MDVKKDITKDNTVSRKREEFKRHVRMKWGMSISGIARREGLHPGRMGVFFNRYWGTGREPKPGTVSRKYMEALYRYTALPEERECGRIQKGNRPKHGKECGIV